MAIVTAIFTAPAHFTPAGLETPRNAVTGDLLFIGDKIAGQGLLVVECIDNQATQWTILAGMTYQAGGPVPAGAQSNKLGACRLPLVSTSTLERDIAIKAALDATGSDFDRTSVDSIQRALGSACSGDEPLGWLLCAANMEERNQVSAAILFYGKVADAWKSAWIKPKIAELRIALHAKSGTQSEAGHLVPLVIGITHYGHLDPGLPDLNFAHLDALSFADYLKRVEPELAAKMFFLIDEQATTAAVQKQLADFALRAPKGGAAVLFFSGHGYKDDNDSYIKTYDAHAGDGLDSALPVEFVLSQLENFSRVYVFIDACRTKVNSIAVSQAVRAAANKGRMLVLMSTEPGMSSGDGKFSDPSGPLHQAGHGAFTYALLKSLYLESGQPRSISVAELWRKLNETMKSLAVQQIPDKAGALDFTEVLDPLRAVPAIGTISLTRSPVLRNAAYVPQQGGVLTPDIARTLSEDLSASTITADSAARAMSIYRELRPDNRLQVRDSIRVALEDAGQRLLLTYLDGDEKEPTERQFEDASTYYQAAAELAPDSPLLKARIAFNEGRARLFDLLKEYDPSRRSRIVTDSLALLDTAYSEDPGPYVLNAMGIAFLEGGDPQRAAGAFRDAIKIAPQWLYPRHNLALTLMRSGKANDAIAGYKVAIGKIPDAHSLHFNLALIYQQINQLKNAEAEYKEVERILTSLPARDPDAMVRLFNARGTLAAQRNDKRGARKWYEAAASSGLKEAVHNLALLSKPAEKEKLLLENIQKTGYLNSRIELAALLMKSKHDAEAIPQYEAIVQEKPDFAAAHIALARLYLSNSAANSSYLSRALSEIQKADTIDHGYWSLYLANAEAAKLQGRLSDANDAYREARRRAPDSSARREIHQSEKNR